MDDMPNKKEENQHRIYFLSSSVFFFFFFCFTFLRVSCLFYSKLFACFCLVCSLFPELSPLLFTIRLITIPIRIDDKTNERIYYHGQSSMVPALCPFDVLMPIWFHVQKSIFRFHSTPNIRKYSISNITSTMHGTLLLSHSNTVATYSPYKYLNKTSIPNKPNENFKIHTTRPYRSMNYMRLNGSEWKRNCCENNTKTVETLEWNIQYQLNIAVVHSGFSCWCFSCFYCWCWCCPLSCRCCCCWYMLVGSFLWFGWLTDWLTGSLAAASFSIGRRCSVMLLFGWKLHEKIWRRTISNERRKQNRRRRKQRKKNIQIENHFKYLLTTTITIMYFCTIWYLVLQAIYAFIVLVELKHQHTNWLTTYVLNSHVFLRLVQITWEEKNRSENNFFLANSQAKLSWKPSVVAYDAVTKGGQHWVDAASGSFAKWIQSVRVFG